MGEEEKKEKKNLIIDFGQRTLAGAAAFLALHRYSAVGQGHARGRVIANQRLRGLLVFQFTYISSQSDESFLDISVCLGTRLYEFHIMKISVFLEREQKQQQQKQTKVSSAQCCGHAHYT